MQTHRLAMTMVAVVTATMTDTVVGILTNFPYVKRQRMDILA